jgi:hypothetical protein
MSDVRPAISDDEMEAAVQALAGRIGRIQNNAIAAHQQTTHHGEQ